MLFPQTYGPFSIKFILRGSQGISLQRACFLAIAGDDVVAVICLNRLADLPRLQSIGSVFKFGDHHAASEPAQVSAVILVGGIFGVFAGKGVPIFSGFQFGEDIFGGFFIIHQNVAGADHFGFEHALFQLGIKHLVVQQDMVGVILQKIEGDLSIV